MRSIKPEEGCQSAAEPGRGAASEAGRDAEEDEGEGEDFDSMLPLNNFVFRDASIPGLFPFPHWTFQTRRE